MLSLSLEVIRMERIRNVDIRATRTRQLFSRRSQAEVMGQWIYG